jgi:hypothetical protein
MRYIILAAKILVIAVPLLVLSGCITFPELKPVEPVAAKPVEKVNVSLDQMCKEAKANKIRASEYYAGKGLTVTGKIHKIDFARSYQPTGSVDITVGDVIVGLEPRDPQAIKRVSNDQTITATGVISSVGLGPLSGKCIIHLEGATGF